MDPIVKLQSMAGRSPKILKVPGFLSALQAEKRGRGRTIGWFESSDQNLHGGEVCECLLGGVHQLQARRTRTVRDCSPNLRCLF